MAFLNDLTHDLSFARRALLRHWPSTVAAVGALALGIGLAIANFTIVNAVLLQPLPYRDPDRLVMIWAANQQQGWDQEKMSVPEMLDWQRSGLFEGVVGFSPRMASITGPGEPELTHSYNVTPGFLSLLGAKPMLGRGFSEDEEKKGGAKNRVLLRHSFWMRRFGGDPSVVGKNLLIENAPHVIVGVMGPDFQFFNRQTDLYLPSPSAPADVTSRARTVRVIARLKDGISLPAARARASVLTQQFAADHPETNRGWTARLTPVAVDTTQPVRPALWVLLASVGMVLLIACANVTNLLLAQGITRAKEIALRVALGASRGRILRQLLTESLLLAGVGGALGYGVAHAAVAFIKHRLPAQYGVAKFLIQIERIQIDGWVALFAAVVVPLAAVFFGLIPAWNTSRSDAHEVLKDTGRGASGGRRARRIQNSLIVAELAIAVILVIGAGLLASSFEQLYKRGPGFRPDKVKSLYISLPAFEYRTHKDSAKIASAYYERVMHSVAQLPGIQEVASTNHLPLTDFYFLTDVEIEGMPSSPETKPHAVDRDVSNSYHQMLSIPLLQGRYFQPSDKRDGLQVALINEQFARRHFQGQSPIGRRVRWANSRFTEAPWFTVVGVVAGERAGGMDVEPKPTIYSSMSQNPWNFFHLMVKTDMDLAATVKLVIEDLRRISPTIAPYEVRTFDEMVLDSTWRVRYSMMMLTGLAGVAVVLAALGVYGVLGYAVRKRSREIGIRMALGATPRTVLRLVTVDGLKLAVIGMAAGLAGAAIFSRYLSTLLVGVRPIEPVLFLAVCAFLTAVVLLASLGPALRAATVQPLDTLRDD